jgi:hypothetical protein
MLCVGWELVVGLAAVAVVGRHWAVCFVPNWHSGFNPTEPTAVDSPNFVSIFYTRMSESKIKSAVTLASSLLELIDTY